MAKSFAAMENSNASANQDIHSVSSPSRRMFVQGGLAAAVGSLFAPLTGCATSAGSASAFAGLPMLGFVGVPVSSADEVTVPMGYTARVIAPWGEPVGIAGNMPAFKTDASNSATEQAVQMGMHHDGMHYFALDGSKRGLLVMNHEYVDDGLLHTDGIKTWSAAKVAKAQAAHGVSVIEVAFSANGWEVVRPSKYARRITASTPMTISGPAAGHAMMKTAADPTGTRVLGTLNNCSHGYTPWGTYLTGEENFAFYFNAPEQVDAHQRRWGVGKADRIRWHEHDERFDMAKHPNEFNRFGWVVEIDPMDPTSTPIKRTALGRAAHEGATVATAADGRAVVYMGEDARFEYIYKFVSRDKIKPGGYAANKDLLDHGTLYVARFDGTNKGTWIELAQGKNGLTAAQGFADQGDVLVKLRQASDLVGGTKMDRPEWIAVDPKTNWVYCTLTNNSDRGKDNRPGTDAANPRADNTMGHIIRWKETGDLTATTFDWNHFVLAGDPQITAENKRGNIKGDAFGSPDGLWADDRGVLWIQTDVSTSTLGRNDYARLGNNVMLAANPATGEIRRFLTGPNGCEITGVIATPDLRTFFVNIQHPGEPANERSDPDNVTRVSRWPANGRPRSATVVITKNDGGVIGT
ncbi:MAG: PhoX family protein [Burkholderiaceae bacterium]